MNIKKLKSKLEKLTQEIIRNVPCEGCGEEIHYILMGKGSAGEEVRYEKMEIKSKHITTQAGLTHSGYKGHKCKKN